MTVLSSSQAVKILEGGIKISFEARKVLTRQQNVLTLSNPRHLIHEQIFEIWGI